ncbi:MAG: tetratricopeptide repeat protein [Opitutales bacterium]
MFLSQDILPVHRSFSIIVFSFLVTAAPAAEPTDLATKRLAGIALREENIYRKIAEDPEFYSADDLERHVSDLIGAYGAYLIDHPRDAHALILYGKLLRRVGRFDEAFTAFLKADEIEPNLAVVKQQIGTHLAEAGKAKAALPFYLRAVELEPDTAIYHYALGQLLHEFHSEYIEEEIFTRDALEREMLKAFKQAVALKPEAFDLQMRLGEAYYDLSSPDWKAALLHWNRLRKATEDELQAEILDLHRARVMGKLGRTGEAITLAQNVQTASLQKSKQQVLDEIARH